MGKCQSITLAENQEWPAIGRGRWGTWPDRMEPINQWLNASRNLDGSSNAALETKYGFKACKPGWVSPVQDPFQQVQGDAQERAFYKSFPGHLAAHPNANQWYEWLHMCVFWGKENMGEQKCLMDSQMGWATVQTVLGCLVWWWLKGRQEQN